MLVWVTRLPLFITVTLKIIEANESLLWRKRRYVIFELYLRHRFWDRSVVSWLALHILTLATASSNLGGTFWYTKFSFLSLSIWKDERICTVCDSGGVGDEFHYWLNCSNENVKRNCTKYVDKYYTYHPNVPKFCSLMNMTSKSKNVKLAKFVSCIFELFWWSQ